MNEFLKKFNIIPKNNKLYETALSHSSFVNEHNLKSDYERLEFLGDAVLELVVSDYLYQNYQEHLRYAAEHLTTEVELYIFLHQNQKLQDNLHLVGELLHIYRSLMY